MKRLIALLTAITFILALPLTVIADTAATEKEVDVALASDFEIVKAGETINFSAVTVKHGSDYLDEWQGAEMVSTYFDDLTDNYVSEAIFKADKPGVYTIAYAITMQAGKSDTVFLGKAEKTIEVIPSKEIIGAEIRNLVVTEMLRPDGSISGYLAQGSIFAIWSDGTEAAKGTVFFVFGKDETSKNVSVSFSEEGHVYEYTVTVQRP